MFIHITNNFKALRKIVNYAFKNTKVSTHENVKGLLNILYY